MKNLLWQGSAGAGLPRSGDMSHKLRLQKNYRRKNICCETNESPERKYPQMRKIHYIYHRDTRSIIWGKNYVVNFRVVINRKLKCLS